MWLIRRWITKGIKIGWLDDGWAEHMFGLWSGVPIYYDEEWSVKLAYQHDPNFIHRSQFGKLSPEEVFDVAIWFLGNGWHYRSTLFLHLRGASI